jgi:uridine kinase
METPSSPSRRYVVERLAEGLARRARDVRVLRVAVDGPDAAGKSTFARQLDDALRPRLDRGAEVRRFSTDEFMVPIQVRRSPVAADPRWLYENVYRLDRIRELIEGSESDPPGSVVLVDGMTLLRPELADLWDVTVFLSITERTTLDRVLVRDREIFEGDGDLETRYRERYFPTLHQYLDRVDPVARADVLVDMHDFTKPVVVRWGGF